MKKDKKRSNKDNAIWCAIITALVLLPLGHFFPEHFNILFTAGLFFGQLVTTLCFVKEEQSHV